MEGFSFPFSFFWGVYVYLKRVRGGFSFYVSFFFFSYTCLLSSSLICMFLLYCFFNILHLHKRTTTKKRKYHPFVTHLSQELSACLPERDHHAAADTSRTSHSLVRRCRGGRTRHLVCTDVAPTHVHKSPHTHVGRERTYMHSETLSSSCDYYFFTLTVSLFFILFVFSFYFVELLC